MDGFFVVFTVFKQEDFNIFQHISTSIDRLIHLEAPWVGNRMVHGKQSAGLRRRAISRTCPEVRSAHRARRAASNDFQEMPRVHRAG